MRGSPQTPALAGHGGKQTPGLVPDTAPRMNCPWRGGAKGLAGSLVTPHTLVDGSVGRSSPGPVQCVLSNSYVLILACVQSGASACPPQGQWGTGAPDSVWNCGLCPPNSTCTQQQTQIEASWKDPNAAATRPTPQVRNIVFHPLLNPTAALKTLA